VEDRAERNFCEGQGRFHLTLQYLDDKYKLKGFDRRSIKVTSKKVYLDRVWWARIIEEVVCGGALDAFLGQFDLWRGDNYVVGNRLPGDVASYPNKKETAEKTRPKNLPFRENSD